MAPRCVPLRNVALGVGPRGQREQLPPRPGKDADWRWRLGREDGAGRGGAAGSPPLSARPVAAGRGRARARRLGRRPPVTAGLAGGDVARLSELTY